MVSRQAWDGRRRSGPWSAPSETVPVLALAEPPLPNRHSRISFSRAGQYAQIRSQGPPAGSIIMERMAGARRQDKTGSSTLEATMIDTCKTRASMALAPILLWLACAAAMPVPLTTPSGQTVSVQNMPFSQAIRTSAPPGLANPWDVQLVFNLDSTINAHDALVLSFYIRSAGAGEVCSEVLFEENGGGWTCSMLYGTWADTDWRVCHVPFRVITPDGSTAYEAGEAGVKFRLGMREQTVDIGGVRLENYWQSPPDTWDDSLTYRGRELNAPWRAEAANRIEQHRKGDLTVRVVDRHGAAVPNAEVTLEMTDHAYHFGTFVASENILGNSGDDDQYRAAVSSMFNHITMGVYWAWNWSEHDKTTVLPGVLDWAEANSIGVRGHTIIYPRWDASPSWLYDLRNSPSVFKDTCTAHVRDVASTLQGRITDYDLINETCLPAPVVDIAGEEAMVEWFRAAKETDPNALLYINDTHILSSNGTSLQKQQCYYDKIAYLLSQEAPLEGIGMQCHMANSPSDPEKAYEVLERYAAFGLPIRVTEYDVGFTDETLQADHLRDLLTIVFSHPSTRGFTLWGFWDPRMWRDYEGLLREDFSLKPSGQTWMDLVYDQWWTPPTSGTTDAAGELRLRGFKGDYTVSVTAPKTVTTALLDARDTVTVQLDISLGGAGRKRARAGRAFSCTLETRNGRPVLRYGGVTARAAVHVSIFSVSGALLRTTTLPCGTGEIDLGTMGGRPLGAGMCILRTDRGKGLGTVERFVSD
ncbi:MAG: hypothetical protein GF331_03705 [Chitinivibrionales bacterium]|nr:hypothetical protein [Chitinivibrionales bacterium]